MSYPLRFKDLDADYLSANQQLEIQKQELSDFKLLSTELNENVLSLSKRASSLEADTIDLGKAYRKKVRAYNDLSASYELLIKNNSNTMAKQAEEMVKNSLDAVVKADPDLARQVREEDDVVDAGRQAVRKLVIQQIQKNPEKVESLLQINSVSKHLERIADMATNIAEDVIYMVEGEIVRHRHRDDVTST